jgi:hypothetical protein
MRERVVAVALGLLLLAGGPARATTLPDCCACVPDHTATTSGGGTPSPVSAVFCGEAERGSTSELQVRCDMQPNQFLTCFANVPGPSCIAQLAAEGILCPAVGAPAAEPLTLTVLIAALAALGAAAVQRRRRALHAAKARS